MVFVPDAVPHFVLVCFENIGWKIRDYSSGEMRLMPAAALGRPIEHIVECPRTKGCFAIGAPQVSITNVRFWQRLTLELGKRFLGARAASGYPVLAESDFNNATSHLKPFEVERLLRS